MDAVIMDGRTLQTGAVAAVHNIANPVSLARTVMDKVCLVWRISVVVKSLCSLAVSLCVRTMTAISPQPKYFLRIITSLTQIWNLFVLTENDVLFHSHTTLNVLWSCWSSFVSQPFQTDHTLVVGEGADELAAMFGVKTKPTEELITEAARKEYEHFLKFKTVVDTSFRLR